jgi:low temperature requirement protein LtrA
MFARLKAINNLPYSHYVIFFSAGVGLELFMNYFHIGEANIYRSIKKNISASRAQEQFDLEKQIYEHIESLRSDNDVET